MIRIMSFFDGRHGLLAVFGGTIGVVFKASDGLGVQIPNFRGGNGGAGRPQFLNMDGKSITGYYEADHDRLDGLFKTFQELKRTDFPKAKQAFVNFKFGLQRHIVWEEEILFPAFEGKTGMKNAGPTEVMRLEHRQIGAALEAIHQKVKHQDPECDREEEALLSLLSSHNMKEENILYPTIDRLLSMGEVGEIFNKMEAVPEERYATCCGGH